MSKMIHTGRYPTPIKKYGRWFPLHDALNWLRHFMNHGGSVTLGRYSIEKKVTIGRSGSPRRAVGVV